MSEGYSGKNSFLFYGDEDDFAVGISGGTIASPANPTAGVTHIPFNPMSTFEWEMPEYEEYEEVFIGNSLASRFSTIKKEGSISLESVYHAPFLLSRIFGTSTTGLWAADATATIAMTMTSYETTTKSIWIHTHLDSRSGSDDIDVNLFGGLITSYGWGIESGDVVKETAEVEIANATTGALAFNAASNFHNQKFALWNHERTTTTTDEVVGIPQNKVTITTTTLIDADIAMIKSASFEMSLPRTADVGIGYESRSWAAKNAYEFSAKMTVKIKGDKPFTEIFSRFENRQVVPFKFLITDDSVNTYYEYVQCTNMRLKTGGGYSIPDATDDSSLELELEFLPTANSVITFAGKYAYATTVNPVSYLKLA